MLRRLIPLAVAAVASTVALAGFTDVTFVMKNGQRLSGTFVYHHTDHYNLIINGKEESYPSDDIAMIAFVPGDPSAEEVNKLPNVNDPPELDRHTMVLRDGTMIRGKIYDFVDDRLIMDVKAGDRRTYNMADIARLYISAPGARGVFRTVPASPAAPAAPPAAGAGDAITVPANQAWTATGIRVTRGQRLTFTATEQIQVEPNVMATPDGTLNASPARRLSLPVRQMAVGGLIGRVGNSGAFPIGSATQSVVMPATGELMLGINDDSLGNNSGAFKVTIQR